MAQLTEHHREIILRDRREQLARHQGRLVVFSAVKNGKDLENAKTYYHENARAIVGGRLNAWAGRLRLTLDEAFRDEAIRTFEKDVKVAEKFQSGVRVSEDTGKKSKEKREKTVYLDDLILEEQNSIRQIENKLE